MKNSTEKSICLKYNLFDLTSAQHKAGLAGLLLLIKSLKKRKLEPCPIVKVSDYSAEIEFTEESLQNVFDYYFTPMIEESKIIPKAEFLKDLEMPDKWINLWRKVVREVLRAGAPRQMNPYKDRLKKPKKWDWKEIWETLLESNLKGLSSSTLLGGESANAEGITFEDRAENFLILHFWPITIIPYIFQRLEKSKDRKDLNYIYINDGYVITIPEIYNLKFYVEEMLRVLPNLPTNQDTKSLIPSNAKISIPEEAALNFLNICQLTSEKQREMEFTDFLSSIHMYYLKYGKGSPDILYVTEMMPDRNIIAEYEHYIKSLSLNNLFKSQRINNLIKNKEWFYGFDRLFDVYPSEFFIKIKEKTPCRIPFFGKDVLKVFQAIKEDISIERGVYDYMSDKEINKILSQVIFDMIRRYLHRQSVEKSNTKDYFKLPREDNSGYPEEYLLEKTKYVKILFLLSAQEEKGILLNILQLLYALFHSLLVIRKKRTIF